MEDTVEVTLDDLRQRLNLRKAHACYLLKVLQGLGLAQRCGFRKRPKPVRGRPANLWRIPRCIKITL